MMITIKNSVLHEKLQSENSYMREKIKNLLTKGFKVVGGGENEVNLPFVGDKIEDNEDEFNESDEKVEINQNFEENEERQKLNEEIQKLNENDEISPLNLPDGITEETRGYIKLLNLKDPGLNGLAVILPANLSSEIQNKINLGYETYGFNSFVSSLISLNRNFPDNRTDYCKTKVYRKDLPKASIIIPFHDDDWSLLMRTVHSIIRYSPMEFVEEIILVDDYSEREHLKDNLNDYVKKLPKVRVVRAHQRLGIVANRVLGARNAVAPILVYVDSHVECGPGWLEPILDRLKDNKNLLVWSKISVINDKNLFLSLDNKTGEKKFDEI